MSTRYMFDPDMIEWTIPLGDDIAMLMVKDGDPDDARAWLVQHVCRSWVSHGEPQQLVMAPALGPTHRVLWTDGLISITPSVRCSACTLHGWVEKNVWTSAKYKKVVGSRRYVYKVKKSGAMVSQRWAKRHPWVRVEREELL